MQTIAIDEMGVAHTFTSHFENLHRLHWVAFLFLIVQSLDRQHGVHRNLGKQIAILADDLRRHGCFGCVDQRFFAQFRRFEGHIFGNEVDGLVFSFEKTRNDLCRMNVLLNQGSGTLQKFSGNNSHRGSTVTNLLILEIGQLDQDFGAWMLQIQTLENGCAIVGDNDIANIIDQHLVQTQWTQRRFDNIRDGHTRRHILAAYIQAGDTRSVDW
mmetsp:Transcript_25773/g.42095  ORF Transcript_25773/g.42095 Transcript_25773/m.42095 type:complete len:213 (-) Transcript_25773:41-679(-)